MHRQLRGEHHTLLLPFRRAPDIVQLHGAFWGEKGRGWGFMEGEVKGVCLICGYVCWIP